MSGPTANCASCGAPISFRWAGAVQTTCQHCNSILVRHGTDLERVGEVSEPPPETSRIQLGTEGSYEGRSFTVVGRIAYAYERGGWSEWHLIFSDGTSGWLSDAMDEYAVTFQVEPDQEIPPPERLRTGANFYHDGQDFRLTDMTPARYAGTEGELPWEYHDQEMITFADLRSPEGEMMTLDYSEDPPLAFKGEYVEFDELRLQGLKDVDEEEAEGVKTLNCPNCASSVTVRQAGTTVNVVCESCSSVLDATSPGAEVLQRFEEAQKVDPLIPLGSSGTIKGDEYTVLGFQVRQVMSEGIAYPWREYLVHNPEEGFRYLTEENGHWNDVITLKSVPDEISSGSQPKVRLHGETFKHFETGIAETTYVLGEWPWEVRVGDTALTDDYVAPPRLLSREKTEHEEVWSLGEYTSGERIWEIFDLPGHPPPAMDVYPNQPSPHAGKSRKMWLTFILLAVLFLGGWVTREALPNSRLVLSESHRYTPPTDSSIVVVGPFTLDGRTSNLMVKASADVSNNWIYFNYSLLDTESGTARAFGREVSYYFGRDSEGSWSEGSREDVALVPSVAAGEYMLRIAPEGPGPVNYTIEIRRDVPPKMFYVGALVLLFLPALAATMRYAAFEGRRWSESDHAEDD